MIRTALATVAVSLVGAAPAAAHSSPDPVITWNRTLLSIVRTPGFGGSFLPR